MPSVLFQHNGQPIASDVSPVESCPQPVTICQQVFVIIPAVTLQRVWID